MEYEKGSLVAMLRGAQERKRKETGKKAGGRKSHAELCRRWLRKPPSEGEGERGRLSSREISTRLSEGQRRTVVRGCVRDDAGPFRSALGCQLGRASQVD